MEPFINFQPPQDKVARFANLARPQSYLSKDTKIAAVLCRAQRNSCDNNIQYQYQHHQSSQSQRSTDIELLAMHNKQIIISNFRSFRTQPEIQPFDQGTNAVVGRNGSGKSNLFDAVQFALLSPKFWTLRTVSYLLY